MDHPLTLHTDLYQLTMMQGYLDAPGDKANQIAVFDVFYRTNPCGNGYTITAGLAQVIDYVTHLHFTEDDLTYLRSLGIFNDAFLSELSAWQFSGEIYAVPEGTIVFPNEPLVRVKARLFEAQMLETAILTIINHQTLIATKAARVVKAASGRGVFEFGARRAQGPDAALFGARAAYVGGVDATSNVLAGQRFGIPVAGTHSHSWVQCFDNELQAFQLFAKTFPDASVLLVDTYDVLKSGIPNAIQVGLELKQSGHQLKGIRIDSGDLSYLSKETRTMLDAAGLSDVGIVASSDLDEYVVQDLIHQGAKIDRFGVGTRLITSTDCPALGCVYKLTAEEENGTMAPKIKLSENWLKVTTPGYKKVVRLYDQTSGKATADLIMLDDETIDPSEPLEIFDPVNTWKRRVVRDFVVKELLVPVFVNGKCVYDQPSLHDIREYALNEQETFWDEVTRLRNPHEYHVDLSQSLWDMKQELIHKYRADRH